MQDLPNKKNSLEKAFQNLSTILEKARTTTTIPKGYVYAPKGEVPDGRPKHVMPGGAVYYLPEKRSKKEDEDKSKSRKKEEKSKRVKKEDQKVESKQDKVTVTPEQLEETKADSYEDIMDSISEKAQELRRKKAKVGDKEELQKINIALALLVTVGSELRKQREGAFPILASNIQANFDKINPKDLTISQLREYVKEGYRREESGEPYNPSLFATAVSRLSKNDAIHSDYRKEQSEKELAKSQAEMMQREDIINEAENRLEKEVSYNKKDTIDMPELSAKDKNEDFKKEIFRDIDASNEEIEKYTKDLKGFYEKFVGIDYESITEINPIESTITVDLTKEGSEQAVNSIKKELVDIYKGDYKNSVIEKTDERKKIVFTLNTIALQIPGYTSDHKTRETKEGSVFYTRIIPSSGSVLNALQQSRKIMTDRNKEGKPIRSCKVLTSKHVIELDPRGEMPNLTLIEGGQGKGKGSIIKANLLNALVNDTIDTKRLAVFDISGKLWTSPEMKRIKEKLMEKGILEDPLGKYDNIGNISGENLVNYVNDMYQYFTEITATQANLLKQSGTDRLEGVNKTVPVYDIHIDEFQELADKIQDDHSLGKQREELISKVSGMVNRLATGSKKLGINASLYYQTNVTKQADIREAISAAEKTGVFLSEPVDVGLYTKRTGIYRDLGEKMRESGGQVASVVVRGEVPTYKYTPKSGWKEQEAIDINRAIANKLEYVGGNYINTIIDNSI